MTAAAIRDRGDAWLAGVRAAIVASGGRSVPVTDLFRACSCSFVVDVCLGPSDPQIVAAVERRTAISDRLAMTGLTYPMWWPSRRVREMVRSGSHLDELLTVEIAERRRRPRVDGTSLLDLILAEDGNAMSASAVHAMIKANLLASNSTPGVALSWIAWALAQHRQAGKVVADEARAAYPGGLPVDERQLPHAAAFVREVLRLYPPIWLLVRRVLRPCRLAGWDLDVGQTVGFSAYLLHRDERWWDAPHEFRPERWLERRSPMNGSYVPFSAGPRVCLGIQVAMYQLTTATAFLASQIDVVPTHTPTMRPAPALVPDGFTARFVLAQIEPTPSA